MKSVTWRDAKHTHRKRKRGGGKAKSGLTNMHLSTDVSSEEKAAETQLTKQEKSKALKLEGRERFEPQAATQQLRAPV